MALSRQEIEVERLQAEKKLLELKKRLLELKEVERRYKSERKMEFFRPFPHQERVFELFRGGKRTVLLQGANRIGKTTTVAVFTGSCCLGYEPWSGRKSVFGGKPIKARVIGVDWEHHIKEVLVPAFKEWLPRGEYETRKNNVGVDYLWVFKNGSVMEFLTHIQDTKQHEGWSGDLVVFDEPPPKDKFIANYRGLIDTGGLCFMAFTAVYESWVLDDIVRSQDPTVGCITGVPITANPTLDETAIKAFQVGLTPEEKVARIEGGWLQLQGLIFKEFDIERHCIEPFEIPIDYPVVAMIDLHLSEKQAVLFVAVDKNNINFVIDEIFENASPEEIADMIKRRKEERHWRIERAYIDPLSKGDKNYFRNRANVRDSFAIIEESLRQKGILLEVSSKDKASGIRNVRNWFKGPNGIPILYIFNTCKRTIWEIQRWGYDENGQPRDKDDHMCENLYRFSLTNTRYISPTIWTENLPSVRPQI